MNTTYWINHMMSMAYPLNEAEIYVGLSSTVASSSGGNVTEPAGNGYYRARISAFTAPNNGVVSNAGNITFPVSSGTWFSATAQAICWVLFNGANASADVIACGMLDQPMVVLGNTTVSIQAGALQIAMSDAQWS